VTDQDIQAFD